jgi:MFS family permease
MHSSLIDCSDSVRVWEHPALCRSERSTLPRTVSFIGVAFILGAVFIAAGAPTPLLLELQRQWHFGPSTLTIAFAVYAGGLLCALLTAGSLSDFIGRRPVLTGALVLETGAMLIFLFAPGIGWVIVARALQGAATGVAASAFTAFTLELAPSKLRGLGTSIGSMAPTAGLALGTLLGGAAVQYLHAPVHAVFGALTIVMVAGTAIVAASPETADRKPSGSRLAPTQISRPAAPGERRECVRGEQLVSPGDTDYPIALVESGQVQVIRPARLNRPMRVLRGWGPGDFTSPTGRTAGNCVAGIALQVHLPLAHCDLLVRARPVVHQEGDR